MVRIRLHFFLVRPHFSRVHLTVLLNFSRPFFPCQLLFLTYPLMILSFLHSIFVSLSIFTSPVTTSVFLPHTVSTPAHFYSSSGAPLLFSKVRYVSSPDHFTLRLPPLYLDIFPLVTFSSCQLFSLPPSFFSSLPTPTLSLQIFLSKFWTVPIHISC